MCWCQDSFFFFHTVIENRSHMLLLSINGSATLNVVDMQIVKALPLSTKPDPETYYVEGFDGSMP